MAEHTCGRGANKTETVEVLVRVFDRGESKRVVVDVPESAFDPASLCWKTTAALAAAVKLGFSFTQVERAAKYGLRPEDRERLRKEYNRRHIGDGEADPSTRSE